MSLGGRTDFYEWTNDVTDELEARAHQSYDGTHDDLEEDRPDVAFDNASSRLMLLLALVIGACIWAAVTVAVLRVLGLMA